MPVGGWLTYPRHLGRPPGRWLICNTWHLGRPVDDWLTHGIYRGTCRWLTDLHMTFREACKWVTDLPMAFREACRWVTDLPMAFREACRLLTDWLLSGSVRIFFADFPPLVFSSAVSSSGTEKKTGDCTQSNTSKTGKHVLKISSPLLLWS